MVETLFSMGGQGATQYIFWAYFLSIFLPLLYFFKGLRARKKFKELSDKK